MRSLCASESVVAASSCVRLPAVCATDGTHISLAGVCHDARQLALVLHLDDELLLEPLLDVRLVARHCAEAVLP